MRHHLRRREMKPRLCLMLPLSAPPHSRCVPPPMRRPAAACDCRTQLPTYRLELAKASPSRAHGGGQGGRRHAAGPAAEAARKCVACAALLLRCRRSDAAAFPFLFHSRRDARHPLRRRGGHRRDRRRASRAAARAAASGALCYCGVGAAPFRGADAAQRRSCARCWRPASGRRAWRRARRWRPCRSARRTRRRRNTTLTTTTTPTTAQRLRHLRLRPPHPTGCCLSTRLTWPRCWRTARRCSPQEDRHGQRVIAAALHARRAHPRTRRAGV